MSKAGLPDLAFAGDENHPWVQSYLSHSLGGSHEGIALDVSAEDEMFHYAMNESLDHRGQALVSYFRSGVLASEIVEGTLKGRFGQNLDQVEILDFASGHGRMTRFVAGTVQPSKLHVCEIGEGANQFQAQTLGVSTVQPSLKPEGFDPGRKFDAVYGFSFFTHMPRQRFEIWLEKLWSTVEEGGILVFSTHGPRAMLPGRRFDRNGFYFEGVSESKRLEIEDYGSSWIEEHLMRQMIKKLDGAGEPVCHERGLWSFQDLWVVPRGGKAKKIELEPLAFLDTCRPLSPREVALSGWALDRSQNPGPLAIDIFVNSKAVASTTTGLPRADVEAVLADAFPNQDAGHAGWALSLELERAVHPTDFLVVEARPHIGRSTVIHASAIEGASQNAALAANDERALHELQSKIHSMEQSRFWKLRNRVVSAKNLFGL